MKHSRSIRTHRGLSVLVVAFTALAVLSLAAGQPGAARAESKKTALFGAVSETSNGSPKHVTDMPEFPGAWCTKGNPDGDGAQATLRLLVLSMRMEALRFETNDSQAKVLAFYRQKLAPFGALNETDHGPNTSFGDFHWAETPGQHSITAEADHRVLMVATKPRGQGCEFALVGLEFEEK
jgi:hypothetical protein